jgi:DNA invertase Pin-like site-specific DNA recombinase
MRLEMQIGYARSSTVDQEAGFQAEIKSLKQAGCEKVFAEKVSSVAERAQLEAALDYAREGDILVITRLDRLARSVSHLVAIGDRLEAKAVALRVLEQAIDTSNCTGRLMFNMLGAIAQFERELMLERQREGIAKAKAEGKYSELQRLGQRPQRFDACMAKGLDQPRSRSDWGSVEQAFIGS